MDHLEFAVRQTLALGAGTFGELEFQLDAVFRKKAFLDTDKERQRPRGRKGIQTDQVFGRGRCGNQRENKGSGKAHGFHGSWPGVWPLDSGRIGFKIRHYRSCVRVL
jgi:hypothetical protein